MSSANPHDDSRFAPLSSPGFRVVWAVAFAGALGVWMNDVAAAWMMTSLTTSPVMVALVQTASTLPMFLLGLPTGAIADMVDRRRFLIWTQAWVACVAIVAWLAMWAGVVNGYLLLVLTFANGIGLAMRYPCIMATMPETVPRHQLPAALGLNSVVMNTSRMVGPALAGLLIATAGTTSVYAVNALIAIASCVLLVRWQHSRPADAEQAPVEPIWRAIAGGVRYMFTSPTMRGILLRVSMFFMHGIAMIALLPLVGRKLAPTTPTVYTMMLGMLGGGSIFTAMVLVPWLRRRFIPERIFLIGNLSAAVCLAGLSLALVTAPLSFTLAVAIALCAMICGGIGWTASGYTLTVQTQMALPNAVRARGMAVYQTAIMGADAVGAALWGALTGQAGITLALLIIAISLATLALLAYKPGSVLAD